MFVDRTSVHVCFFHLSFIIFDHFLFRFMAFLMRLSTSFYRVVNCEKVRPYYHPSFVFFPFFFYYYYYSFSLHFAVFLSSPYIIFIPLVHFASPSFHRSFANRKFFQSGVYADSRCWLEITINNDMCCNVLVKYTIMHIRT